MDKRMEHEMETGFMRLILGLVMAVRREYGMESLRNP